MSSITVTQLKYFEAVARHGGFSKAAEHINMSQPALTRHIQTLEEECRVSLFRRTGRGVHLTAEGQSLLDAAKVVLGSLDNAQEVARSFTRDTLRIRSVSTPKLAELMRICESALPKVKLDVAVATYDQILAAVSARQCDLGILTLPAEHCELDVIEIGKYRYHAYVPKSHAWAERGAISIHDLQGQKLIISPRIRRSRQVFDEFLVQYGVDAQIAQEVGSVETIWHLVKENFGVGILSANGQVAVEGLVQLTFAEPLLIPLHAVALPAADRTRLINIAFAAASKSLPDRNV